MAEIFRHPHRVIYAECTVGNHVYHSRYLDLLEAARGEFIRSLGATVLELQEDDFMFPVIEAKLRYKFPARYDDLLTIEVWPTVTSPVRLNFGHRITNQNSELILEAETFHVCTSTREKPKRMPPELMEKLRQHSNSSLFGLDFKFENSKVTNCLQEEILFYLIQREQEGKITKGKDLLYSKQVEPLVQLGLIRLEQSHAVPSLENSVMATTVLHLTETGRRYFER
jgi:acyl-CoA thioester hydrolase